MNSKVIEINMFGSCLVRSCQGVTPFEITSAKHCAMLALLATAPLGRCRRSFLQDMLWGSNRHDKGRPNLRRALLDIKKQMGDEMFAQVFRLSNVEVSLNLDAVQFEGGPESGLFLQGIKIKEPSFQDWLARQRANPQHLAALFQSDEAS